MAKTFVEEGCFLRFLLHAASSTQVYCLLDTINLRQTKLLSNIIFNLLKGVFDIDDIKIKLRPHANFLRQIATRKESLAFKRNAIRKHKRVVYKVLKTLTSQLDEILSHYEKVPSIE